MQRIILPYLNFVFLHIKQQYLKNVWLNLYVIKPVSIFVEWYMYVATPIPLSEATK